MILENHGWLCSCGEAFAEPELCTGHIGAAKHRAKALDTPPGDHKPLGYCDLDTHVQALSWNWSMWKGKWKGMLDKKVADGDLPFVTIAEAGLGAHAGGAPSEVGDDEDEDEERRTGEVTEAPVATGKKGQRSPIGGMAKVVFRPQVFDIDESLVHLYNLFLASMHHAHINYEPSIGEWLRDVVFQHYFEHPEVLDLSSLLMPSEKAALILQREEQHARA